MILQALTKYYDILSAEADESEDSNIAQPGYSVANVSYALNLSKQGELLDVFPLSQQVQRGKKMVDKPLSMIIPEQAGRSGKTPPAYFLCDNNAYVLGISVEDEDKPEYSQQRLEAFHVYNKEILSEANCIEAKAVIAFLEKYDPVAGRKHPVIASILDDILKAGKLNFVFMVDNKYVHKNAEIRQIWEARNQSSEDDYIGQCLITGEIAPIARIHDIKIKGIAPYHGGVALVGFNDRAYESYNRTKGQGLNSPVSKKAMLAYSKALNHLLSDANENKKIVIGDTTVVYWAEGNNKACSSLFAGLTEVEFDEPSPDQTESEPTRGRKGEEKLRKIAEKIKRGEKLDQESLIKEIDWNTRFYVLGLEAPNRGRASIRFFYSDPFIKFVKRIGEHYLDLQLGESEKPIKLRWILNETVSKKAREQKISPLLTGALFTSMLTNSPYPAALYNAIMIRVRADMDDEDNQTQKISYVRVAVIKAYLKRKHRHQSQKSIQEALVMSLNEKSTYPAYVLGRLFAVLESAQIEAAKPEKLNSTIKDRFFGSACASPATVFPILLRLSQHHISKIDKYGNDRRIQTILNLLDFEKNPIPSHLTLDDQGVFVLGYYHQRADFYVSKADRNPVESTSSETN
jgi:CRISPR-associated protein Csd1